MKAKLGIGLFVLLVISGIVTSVYFGLAPKPIPKIKLSVIENPRVLANAVQHRMSDEFAKANIIAFGYQPEHPQQLEVIQEWYKSQVADVWLAEAKLQIDPRLLPAENIDSQNNFEELVNKIQNAVNENKRVALVLPAVYSSQMVQNNLVDLLKQRISLPITSFSVVELLRTRDQEKSIILPCRTQPADPTGFGKLGCAILRQSQMLYRKQLQPGKKVAWMDQRGSFDYLIFYSND